MSRGEPALADESSSLVRLRSLLLAEGGLIASLVGPTPAQPTQGPVPGTSQGPAQLAARGPRAEGRREEYELLVDAIYEGYLLHYGSPRVVLPPGKDLRVLAGDRLYALGLHRLVKLGDMDAVAELADVITLTALAQSDGREQLAQAIWEAGARAVGWGPGAEHERAKQLARTGAPEALAALQGGASD